MKRLLSLLLILTLATLCSGCISAGGGGGGSGGNPVSSGASEVTLDFNFGDMLAANRLKQDSILAKIIDFITMSKTCHAAYLYEFITSLHIEVTGAGMSPITHDETIASPSSTFSVTLTVPNGPDRRFYVELKDRNNEVLYSGILTIDIGDYQGNPQDISIIVTLDGKISVEYYIEKGRGYLESQKLELAFVAFDTAVSLDRDHPVANFFRGFVHLLLLVQKDDEPDVDVDNTPHADIVSMLNFYANLDVYSDIMVYNDPMDPEGGPYYYDIAPDIYDEDEIGVNVPGLADEAYDDKVKNFFDNDWQEPPTMITDDGVDVLRNVILPELDNVISDLANAEADPVFSTTLTTGMYFGIEPTIKVDRADVYVLEAIAYGLKAYLNHYLAYTLRTDAKWWKDNLDPDSPIYDPEDPAYIGHPYIGVQDVIERDPGNEGEEVFDLTGSADSYLNAAKSAYSNGLDKLKAGLQFIRGRSIAAKNAEDHIFNVADISDPVDAGLELNKINIDKVIETIDDAKAALNAEAIIIAYDDYEDTSAEYNSASVDFSTLLSSATAPDRDSLPNFYYHVSSESDLVMFDTNADPASPESSSAFIEAFTGVMKSIDGQPIASLEDALSEDLLPPMYKFNVPVVGEEDMSIDGELLDYDLLGIRPVMFNVVEDDKPEWRDLIALYLAQDNTYLYVAIELTDAPFGSGEESFGEGDFLNYSIRFNARYDDCDWYAAPVTVQLYGDDSGWSSDLISYGNNIANIDGLLTTDDYGMQSVVELRIPLRTLSSWIGMYQDKAEWTWDRQNIFIAANVWGDISSVVGGDWIEECLADSLINTYQGSDVIFTSDWHIEGGGTELQNELYSIKKDGTGLSQITDNAYLEYHADVSPTRQEIVTVTLFEAGTDSTGELDTNAELVIWNFSGTQVRRLTDDSRSESVPHWSPDGEKIVFFAGNSMGSLNIYVINRDGTGETQLTSDGYSVDPSFTPFGRIIFSRGNSIMIMDSNGSNLTTVVNLETAGLTPEDPVFIDSNTIAFEAKTSETVNSPFGDYDIFLVDADGTNLRDISDNTFADAMPQPVGDKITFWRVAAGVDGTQLMIMDKDGSNKESLLTQTSNNQMPTGNN